MKTRFPAAKAPLPEFRSDEAAAEYFQTHSVAGVWINCQRATQLNRSLNFSFFSSGVRHVTVRG
jgi:hypothetical protein